MRAKEFESAAVNALKKDLKNPLSYDAIDHMMTTIAEKHGITPKKLHDLFVEKTGMIPDDWIKQKTESSKVISELYDPKSAYQLEWDDQFGPEEIHARAYDRQGHYIDINFVPVYAGIVDIEFSKNDSYDATGSGDAPMVFATVLEAIRRYLQGYRPNIMIFTGKGDSRYKLYQRIVTRYAQQAGYRQIDVDSLSDDEREQIGLYNLSNVFILRRV